LRGFRGLQVMRTGVRYWQSRYRFQSPCGVLGVCRALSLGGMNGAQIEFQSPCGVLGVCRHQWREISESQLGAVSVPLRGFRGLQESEVPFLIPEIVNVSVPLRGFRGLQVWEDFFRNDAHASFQSPCGVLGVCRSGLRNPPGWCGCPSRPGFLIPRAL